MNQVFLRRLSTFSNTCFLMSRSFNYNFNNPITIFYFRHVIVKISERILFLPIQDCTLEQVLILKQMQNASFTILLRIFGFALSSSFRSKGTISSKSTSTPMLAKCNAIPEPITPEPRYGYLSDSSCWLCCCSFHILFSEQFIMKN
jgi:hypothetical protein